jgi:hypothetical protein
LSWEPNLFRRKSLAIDVTPDWADRFDIGAREGFTLEFNHRDKFDWGHKIATRRHLCLMLHSFGRRKPKVLKICPGM